jgi:hypothetical protein
MAKISAAEVNHCVEEVAERLAAGYTDQEIMDTLRLKRRTFYDYKARVYKIFGDLAMKKTEGRLEFEWNSLKDRYIRLFRNLEEKILAKDKKTGRGQDLKYVANASEVAALIATNILRLEFEAFNERQTRRELRQGEQKAHRYFESLSTKINYEPTY